MIRSLKNLFAQACHCLTVRTNMTPIHQKTPDYCFVACVASALLDEGYDKLQDLIVERFPNELKQPSPQKVGVPATWSNSERVIKQLGLAVTANFHKWPVEEAINFLKANKHMAKWIFINTNAKGYHLVRLSEVRDAGITVMDPTDGTIKDWTWPQLRKEYYALVVRDWK
jgi:hypothetical protein